jgi:hypothetical protein
MRNRQILSIFSCILICACACLSQDNAPSLCLPNPQLIGQEFKLNGIDTYIPVVSGTKPSNISFDLENGIVVGMVVKYPSSITYTDLENALSKLLINESKRKLDDQMTVWRDKEERYNVTLGVGDSGTMVVIRKPIRFNK